MNREYVIAGNWKMYKTGAEARELVQALAASFTAVPGLTVVVFPPFTALESVRGLDPKVRIGAQNVFYEEQGAFTGEVAPRMLAGLAEYVLVGHSERRQVFHESDADVARKLRAALAAGLKPVLCLGETLPERESNATLSKVDGQLDAALAGVSGPEWGSVLVAYEPIWAIGTGRTATPQQAQEVHRHLRLRLEAMAPSRRVPILDGGSVKPENSLDLLSQEDIDGLLVGGASLKAGSFSAIINGGSQLLRS